MTDPSDEIDGSAPVNSGDENVDELLLRALHAQGWPEIWACGVVSSGVAGLVSWTEPARNIDRVVTAGHNIVVARASRAGASVDRGSGSSGETPRDTANRHTDRPVVAVVLSAAAISAVADPARLANLIDQGARHGVSVVLSCDSSVLDATMSRRTGQPGSVQVGRASALEWAQARLARPGHRPTARPPSTYPGIWFTHPFGDPM